jgi:hypothetical protein
MFSGPKNKEPKYVNRRTWSASELFREFDTVVNWSSKILNSHLEIHGARRATRSKVHTQDPKNKRSHRQKFSLQSGLEPEICASLEMRTSMGFMVAQLKY